MSDDLVKQAMAELTDVVRCRCNEAYTGRGLRDPDCQCDSAKAVKVVADRIEELEGKLAKAVKALGGMVGLFSGYNLLLKGMHLKIAIYNARAALAELKGKE